jgi:hypothetical protein
MARRLCNAKEMNCGCDRAVVGNERPRIVLKRLCRPVTASPSPLLARRGGCAEWRSRGGCPNLLFGETAIGRIFVQLNHHPPAPSLASESPTQISLSAPGGLSLPADPECRLRDAYLCANGEIVRCGEIGSPAGDHRQPLPPVPDEEVPRINLSPDSTGSLVRVGRLRRWLRMFSTDDWRQRSFGMASGQSQGFAALYRKSWNRHQHDEVIRCHRRAPEAGNQQRCGSCDASEIQPRRSHNHARV